MPTEQSKQKMLRIARQTAGVTELRDQLRVDPAVSAQRAGRAPLGRFGAGQAGCQKIAGAIAGTKAGKECVRWTGAERVWKRGNMKTGIVEVSGLVSVLNVRGWRSRSPGSVVAAAPSAVAA